MSEKIPYHESLPSEYEVRRDALLLRIAELRQAVKATTMNQVIVSKELDELDRRVQNVAGWRDMEIFEGIFDTLEQMVVDTLK